MASISLGREVLSRLPERLQDSWLRCVDTYGLRAQGEGLGDLLCAAELRQARERMGSLMRLADPELDRLHGIVCTLDYTVMLTDADGVVMARRGDTPNERGCRRWHLWPGARWGETQAGTNGVGTCLVDQRPTTVHMDQHWRLGLRYLTCTAVPFYGADGRVAGAFDVSSTRPDPTGRTARMMEAVLVDVARRMERRAFLEAFHNRTVVILGEGDGISLPMVAMDESQAIVGATFGARARLGLPVGDVSGVCFDPKLGIAGPVDFQAAERVVIEGALATSQGKVMPAARLLGISRSTLHRKIRALKIGR